MIHKKKKKKKEGKFRLFQPYSRSISAVSGLFRPYRLPADTSWYGRYGQILAESIWFGANRSRFSTNRAVSARIRGKKNTQTRTDARATALDAGAVPLVLRPCFLDNKKEIHFPIYSEFKIGKS